MARDILTEVGPAALEPFAASLGDAVLVTMSRRTARFSRKVCFRPRWCLEAKAVVKWRWTRLI